jgi:hypothetical protein
VGDYTKRLTEEVSAGLGCQIPSLCVKQTQLRAMATANKACWAWMIMSAYSEDAMQSATAIRHAFKA